MGLSWKYLRSRVVARGVLSLVIRWEELPDSLGTFPLQIDPGEAFTTPFNSALSNLYHYYELYSARKYVEQFSNGVTIISLYLNPMPQSNAAPIESSIFQVMKEASLLYCLPDNPFFLNPDNSNHAVQEATYACKSIC
jgi:hypothetical protein